MGCTSPLYSTTLTLRHTRRDLSWIFLLSLPRFSITSCHEFEVKRVKEEDRAKRKEVSSFLFGGAHQEMNFLETSACLWCFRAKQAFY